MLAEIVSFLEVVLVDLGLFGSVNALSETKVVYPEAHIWLAKDDRVQDKPSVTRALTWAVQVTSFDDNASTSLLPIIDAVRDALSGMRLPGHGHMPIEVPAIELVECKRPGPVVYVITARLHVFPENFTLT